MRAVFKVVTYSFNVHIQVISEVLSSCYCVWQYHGLWTYKEDVILNHKTPRAHQVHPINPYSLNPTKTRALNPKSCYTDHVLIHVAQFAEHRLYQLRRVAQCKGAASVINSCCLDIRGLGYSPNLLCVSSLGSEGYSLTNRHIQKGTTEHSRSLW